MYPENVSVKAVVHLSLSSLKESTTAPTTFTVMFVNVVLDKQLVNVAFANALQLEAARAMPVIFYFCYDDVPSLKLLNLSIAVL